MAQRWKLHPWFIGLVAGLIAFEIGSFLPMWTRYTISTPPPGWGLGGRSATLWEFLSSLPNQLEAGFSGFGWLLLLQLNAINLFRFGTLLIVSMVTGFFCFGLARRYARWKKTRPAPMPYLSKPPAWPEAGYIEQGAGQRGTPMDELA